ncbi:VOC family protein [Trinickia sp. NRRL B-1857]|uniref:VOC family protein n=1 Tax=Trinickia sp. NRRL B-1857 TaxID=3162879 RepID=UPI003D28838D
MQALRIARPVTDLARAERMYCAAFGLKVLSRFEDHKGFDGVMLGSAGMDYHFEFTYCTQHPVTPSPTCDDLMVFYVPDREEWQSLCDRAEDNGFVQVRSFNPYWDVAGRTYADPDGYRIVLQQGAWKVDSWPRGK